MRISFNIEVSSFPAMITIVILYLSFLKQSTILKENKSEVENMKAEKTENGARLKFPNYTQYYVMHPINQRQGPFDFEVKYAHMPIRVEDLEENMLIFIQEKNMYGDCVNEINYTGKITRCDQEKGIMVLDNCESREIDFSASKGRKLSPEEELETKNLLAKRCAKHDKTPIYLDGKVGVDGSMVYIESAFNIIEQSPERCALYGNFGHADIFYGNGELIIETEDAIYSTLNIEEQFRALAPERIKDGKEIER